jgi:hypothetical protein
VRPINYMFLVNSVMYYTTNLIYLPLLHIFSQILFKTCNLCSYQRVRYYVPHKAKAVPLHAIEALWGRGGIAPAPAHSDLFTRWGWVITIMHRPRFAPGKGPPVPTVLRSTYTYKTRQITFFWNFYFRLINLALKLYGNVPNLKGGHTKLINILPDTDTLLRVAVVALGGLVVACSPLVPRFADSKPAEDNAF